jgi:hypothetical protein
LLKHDSWASDSGKIQRLFAYHTKDRLPEPLPEHLHARGVVAALQGPQDVVAFVLEHGARVNCVSMEPYVRAVFPNGDARKRLLAALHEPTTALAVRQAIELACTQWEEGIEVPAAEWLLLGSDPVRAETRTFATMRATAQLGPNDAQALDQLLGWLVVRDCKPEAHEPELVCAFANGMRSNRQAELLPWTPARLRAVFLALPSHPDAQIDDAVMLLTRRETTRTMLVQMLFAEPLVLATAFRQAGDDNAAADNLARNFLGAAGSEADAQMHGRRWNAAIAEALAAAWPKCDDTTRIAALLVLRGAHCHVADKRPIAKALTELRVAATGPVQAAIDGLLAIVGG